MSSVDKFVGFLKDRNLIGSEGIRHSLRQYKLFDRRFGQLAVFLGYIQPEDVNVILLEQARKGGLFGECAMRLQLMTPQQIGQLARLQSDDLSIFAQSVGIQHAATPVELASYLTEFVRDNPAGSLYEDMLLAEPDQTIHPNIQDILRQVEHISPLPGTVARVVALLDDPEVKLDEVAKALKLDPGLTSTLLRVVNSAFYGLRSKIGSVKKALQVLGTSKLRQLVVVAGVMQKFQSVSAEWTTQFWETSIRTAECSKELGKYCRIVELDELFVCGLLHNIGELVLKQIAPESAERTEQAPANQQSALEAEQRIYGGTHADIGGFLLSIWNLPKATVQSTMYHHHDYNLLTHLPKMSDEVFIVHMATTTCGLNAQILSSYDYSKMLDLIGERYRRRLNYTPLLDLDRLMERVDLTVDQLDRDYLKN